MDQVKSVVLSRLAGHTRPKLSGLDNQYQQLHSLLFATITRGEGNSILLLGPRGVGKTCLVENSLSALKVEHGNDFHVVRLNGFMQTDDKMALREIWRQLGREMEIQDEETAQVSSYADTMASLLHLLSHPDEWAESMDPSGLERTARSVIFVIDEFDLFTTHPRQTLLYNLLDIAQARKAPVAVVGCSVRIDVGEQLEKRVKSRFSHRWIYLPLAKSLPTFEEALRTTLMLDESSGLPKIGKELSSEWNTFVKVCIRPWAPAPGHHTDHRRA